MRKHFLISLLFTFLFAYSKAQDKCPLTIGTYFYPDCMQDTCLQGWWFTVDPPCNPITFTIKIYDSFKELIYSNTNNTFDRHLWDGKLKDRRCYCPSGTYSYELEVLFENNTKQIKKGEVYLGITNPKNICNEFSLE